MWGFLAGITVAVVLAAGTYLAMDAGTVTQVERSNTFATLIDDVWQEGGWFREPEDRQRTEADGS